jgi:hypothetical protein
MKVDYWISLKFATFVISATNDVITIAAPIANWTIGKNVHVVLDYFRKKGATIEVMKYD